MKILKRHSIFFNVLFFNTFLLIFVHIIIALDQGIGFLNKELIVKNVFELKYLLYLYGITTFGIMKYWKRSTIFLGVYYIAVAIMAFNVFLINYDKFILSLNFFAFVFSYFIYLNWDQALNFSCYNPMITKRDLELPIKKLVNGKVLYSGKEYEMSLMNWDNIGCFLYSEEFVLEKNKECEIEFEFDGTSFKNKGKIVSLVDKKGIGILFEYNKDIMSWKEFYRVLDERGYLPSYIAC